MCQFYRKYEDFFSVELAIACLTITKFDKVTKENGIGDIFKVKVSLGLVFVVCTTLLEKG